jgi:hypothetical protein
VRERRPDLLAGDDPLVAVALGPRLEVGEVGAGFGLRVALAPQFLTRGDLRQEPPLLLLGAVVQDRGPDQALAHDADAPGPAGTGVLLVEDDLLEQARAPAAVLLRERQAHPAGRAERPLPGEALLEQRVLVAGTAAAAHAGELTGQLLREPAPRLGAERLELGREPEVHAAKPSGGSDGSELREHAAREVLE